MAHGVRVAASAASAAAWAAAAWAVAAWAVAAWAVAAWAVAAAGAGSGSGRVGVEPPVGQGLELGGMLVVVDPGSTLTDCRSVQNIHNNNSTVLHQYHELL